MSAGNSDLPTRRRRKLLEYINKNGQSTINDLSENYGVSVDTIRRDLDRLVDEGYVTHTRGDAVSTHSSTPIESTLTVRSRLNTCSKNAIGMLAASLTKSQNVVLMNVGSTILSTVPYLRGKHDLTIGTNNLSVAQVLPENCCRDLYLFGGIIRIHSQATIGPIRLPSAVNGLDTRARADIAFISVGGVEETLGYTTSYLAEANMMAEMADTARTVVVLVDSLKIGHQLFCQIGSLSMAGYFTTEKPLPNSIAYRWENAGVTVLTPS